MFVVYAIQYSPSGDMHYTEMCTFDYKSDADEFVKECYNDPDYSTDVDFDVGTYCKLPHNLLFKEWLERNK